MTEWTTESLQELWDALKVYPREPKFTIKKGADSVSEETEQWVRIPTPYTDRIEAILDKQDRRITELEAALRRIYMLESNLGPVADIIAEMMPADEMDKWAAKKEQTA